VENGKEYWLMFENFQVIRRYNNSNFYSMTVFELAEALRQAHP
jgi:membrane-bound lytic murein transglycosylase B